MTGGAGNLYPQGREGRLRVCSEAYGEKGRQDYEGSRNVRIHLCALRGADVERYGIDVPRSLQPSKGRGCRFYLAENAYDGWAAEGKRRDGPYVNFAKVVEPVKP